MMRKALFLGLCLSTATGAQATLGDLLANFTLYPEQIATIKQLAPAVKRLAVIGVVAVGAVGALAITGEFMCWLRQPQGLLKSAENALAYNICGVNVAELMKQTNSDPAKAAATVQQYYNATVNSQYSYDGRQIEYLRFSAFQAVDNLASTAKDLAFAEAGLREELKDLWSKATIKKFNEYIPQVAAAREFLCAVINIIKLSDWYKQQVEQQQKEVAQEEQKRQQSRETDIREAQARATRKIIVHQDGHQETVTVQAIN